MVLLLFDVMSKPVMNFLLQKTLTPLIIFSHFLQYRIDAENQCKSYFLSDHDLDSFTSESVSLVISPLF